jgi:predicted nucleotidyltransferase
MQQLTQLEQVRAIIAENRDVLDSLGAESIAVFGSVARGEARPDSDVDLLVKIRRPCGLIGFVRLQRKLEELLGRRVDLVEEEALHPALRDRILAEAVRAA